MKIYFLVLLQAANMHCFAQGFFLFGRKMPHDAEILKKLLNKRSLKGNATNLPGKGGFTAAGGAPVAWNRARGPRAKAAPGTAPAHKKGR